MATILRSMVVWSKSYTDDLANNEFAAAEQQKKAANDDDAAGAPPVPLLKQTSGGDELNRFEAAKNLKRATKEGIQLFNWKYKKGISYLIQHGVFQKTPSDIARFLLKTPGLDKKMIGEYLGEGEEFNIQVMHAFVDQMDFVGLKFVDALRLFLQSFRLPGEAQKIDRFMLKFAERFLRGNPSAFSNADCAYVLAYSVIMLNTDLHNPQIKKRMKKVYANVLVY
jgi:brefeldin A-inhibited guanine nucleotide-exchange protein